MASSCHVSVKPEMAIEEEAEKTKMCKDLLSSDLVFDKKGSAYHKFLKESGEEVVSLIYFLVLCKKYHFKKTYF